MQGNVERKIETLTNIVYNMGKEMFGSKGNQRSEQKKNRPQIDVSKECRKERKALYKLFRR